MTRRVVIVAHGDGGLENDGTGVELFIHEMHRAAGDADAVFQRLLLRVEAGKGGQQGGVNVEDAAGELANEPAR